MKIENKSWTTDVRAERNPSRSLSLSLSLKRMMQSGLENEKFEFFSLRPGIAYNLSQSRV